MFLFSGIEFKFVFIDVNDEFNRKCLSKFVFTKVVILHIANIETDTFLNNSQTQTTTCFYFIPHIEKM
jgi:isochorismate synthase EntC